MRRREFLSNLTQGSLAIGLSPAHSISLVANLASPGKPVADGTEADKGTSSKPNGIGGFLPIITIPCKDDGSSDFDTLAESPDILIKMGAKAIIYGDTDDAF